MFIHFLVIVKGGSSKQESSGTNNSQTPGGGSKQESSGTNNSQMPGGGFKQESSGTHHSQAAGKNQVKNRCLLARPDSVYCFYIDSDSLLFLLFIFSFNTSLRETKFSVHQ